MRYYTVWVRSQSYRGHEPLTYGSSQTLRPGAVVKVELQKEAVLGFVGAEVAKPSFRIKPISHVYGLPPLPPQTSRLAAWLQEFYGTNLGAAAQQFLPPILSEKTIASVTPVVASTISAALPELTAEQRAAMQAMAAPDTYLLHGRTGSGKTRVYIELAQQALRAGKSAIILTPEIGLTSQLAHNLQAAFGEQVIVLHSQLTPAERQRAWVRILKSQGSRVAGQESQGTNVIPSAAEGSRDKSSRDLFTSSRTNLVRDSGQNGTAAATPLVVAGPRSALFSPLSNIGLIVVDEEHETAYKQEQAPYYHAIRVASQLARLHGATLVLGSATPSVADYYLAGQRGKPILEMKNLAKQTGNSEAGLHNTVTAAAEPDSRFKILDSKIVDLKDRGNFSRSQQLSTPLLTAVQTALAKGEQSLIYLNRRGTARVVLCENCGWQAACPHCDLPLVYHGDNGQFRCHTCGYHERLRTSCPVCGHPSILFKTFGTKAIFEEVQRLFPEARVQRFDTDNAKNERFEQHYEAIRAGEVDILVGTQLLAKGLDLPRLSTLGIVLADSSLYLPDFSSGERTYQLLSQVLGRVGRGHVAGTAIIQTYHPESPILAAAISGEWDEFYKNELRERQLFHFPPFYHLLKLSCRRASAASAETAAEKLKLEIASKITGVEIDGPVPSFHEKLQGKYQFQLVIKSANRAKLLQAVKLIPSGWSYDIDPVNLL